MGVHTKAPRFKLSTSQLAECGVNPETDKVICNTCKEPKLRIRHSRNASGRWRFTGENGKMWNGSMCPDCHKRLVAIKLAQKKAGPC